MHLATDGAYTLRFRAVDTSGNVDATPALIDVVVNTSAPTTTVSTANGTTFFGSIQITGSASDAAPGVLSAVEVSTDNGSSWAPVSDNALPNWSHTFSASADGSYTLQFRARDRAGNVQATPTSVTVVHLTPDTTPPDTAVFALSGTYFNAAPIAMAG